MGGIVDAIFGGNDAPPAPDPNPGMIASAQSSERVGMEMADIAREQLAWSKERAAKTDATAERLVDSQIKIAEKNAALSDDYEKYMKETYRPVEKEVVKRALDYNTDEEMEKRAARAKTDVATQFDNQRGQVTRNMGRYGLRPDAGRFAAINMEMAANEAAASAGAADKGREEARTYGHALLMDAASLGRNLPANQATSAGVAMNANQSAAAIDSNAARTSTAVMDSTRGWYGGALQGTGQAGQIYGNQYATQMSGYNASLNYASQGRGQSMEMVGAIAGAAALAFSDRRLKSDIERVGDFAPGIGLYDYTMSGRRFRGVMADEVEKVRPDLVRTDPAGYQMVNYAGLGLSGPIPV